MGLCFCFKRDDERVCTGVFDDSLKEKANIQEFRTNCLSHLYRNEENCCYRETILFRREKIRVG